MAKVEVELESSKRELEGLKRELEGLKAEAGKVTEKLWLLGGASRCDDVATVSPRRKGVVT
ncbi:hypothetical protein H1R20_g14800, partial [Candolleomyces eurysporus]